MGGMWVLLPKLQGSSFWVESGSTGSGGWATVVALLFILICHCIRMFFSSASSKPPVSSIAPAAIVPDHSRVRISEIVSDADLKFLIENLNENIDENARWENVVDKRNNLLSYKAKCCKPKDGPLIYWSVTVFENCSPEILRDFYLENDYRKQWDKTVIEHEQLQVDKTTGIEIGRTIKKFPLLSPREYILAWRLWEGSDKSFYCFIKECEHPLAPPQKKYVRVRFYRSGWKISKVPGRNASEIKMFHQEDSGLNGEMAKLAFARGIWSYVCKMEKALRKYSTMNHLRASAAVSATSLIQKVPPELDTVDDIDAPATPAAGTGQFATEARDKKLSKRPSRKLIANGLLLLGGVICLSRGQSSLGAKVAMACILTKWHKLRHGSSSSQDRSS